MFTLYPTTREPIAHSQHRSKQFIDWLFKRSEDELIVVSHSAFLRGLLTCGGALVEMKREYNNEEFIRFQNCELRTYDIYYYS